MNRTFDNLKITTRFDFLFNTINYFLNRFKIIIEKEQILYK